MASKSTPRGPKYDLSDFLTRRNFLKISGGCAALSSTSLLSTLLDLKLTKAALAAVGPFPDYKAIVCVFLSGGIDSYNMLMPYEDVEYAAYSATRTNLALPKNTAFQVLDRTGRKFGIHPGMPEMRDLYNASRLAFIANVGSLVVPTTKANLNTVPKPVGLYSHSDLIRHWQTSVPQSRREITGWAGRMADMVTDSINAHPDISMNISLGGLNILETGRNVVPYTIGTGGATVLNSYSKTTTNARDRIFTKFCDSSLGQTYGDLLEKSYARERRGALDAAITFNAIPALPATIIFPNTSLGNQLKMVARTIAARAALGATPGTEVKRQIFFVTTGGWDHHADLVTGQASMLPPISAALKAFYDATVTLGVANNVTTYTFSDFARTLQSNGVGSDHAWGGNQMVMGGAVSGGHVYGNYPTTLALNNILDTGRGRLIPTTAVDSYSAELAMWFGMRNDNDLVSVFPNIRNFYSASSVNKPLGFLP